jgi:F-type H+-transporting ATPase subunit epsilon
MILNFSVMAPNRIVLNSQADEIILSTNSGQIGILPNHAPLLTALDIGIIKIRTDQQWTTMALMGGFAMIESNQCSILVNDAEMAKDIDSQEVEKEVELAIKKLSEATNKKQIIEANLALKRAKARLQAVKSMT